MQPDLRAVSLILSARQKVHSIIRRDWPKGKKEVHSGYLSIETTSGAARGRWFVRAEGNPPRKNRGQKEIKRSLQGKTFLSKGARSGEGTERE